MKIKNNKKISLALTLTSAVMMSGCAMISPQQASINKSVNTAQLKIAQNIDKTLITATKADAFQIKDSNYIEEIKATPLWLQTEVSFHGNFTLQQVVRQGFESHGIIVLGKHHLDLSQVVYLDYSGNLAGLLPRLSGMTSLDFTAAEHTLSIKALITRQFYINATPGSANFSVGNTANSGVQIGSVSDSDETSSSSSSGSAGDKNQDSGDVSVWSDVENAMSKLVSQKGTYTIQQSTSILTVIDNINAINRIAQWVKLYNKALSAQVSFKIQILTVKLNNDFKRGINWNVLYHDLSISQSLINTIASYNPVSAGSIVGLTLKKGDDQAVVQYLKQFGEVYTNQQPVLTTMNNKVAQLNQIQNTGYLKQVTSSVTPSAGTTTSQETLTPGTVTTGLELNILPHVENKRIFMKIDLSLGNLEAMNSQGSEKEGSQIQLPVTTEKQFNQSAVLENGQTLLLGGYVSHAKSYSNASNFDVSALGANASSISTFETIFLITAYTKSN